MCIYWEKTMPGIMEQLMPLIEIDFVMLNWPVTKSLNSSESRAERKEIS
jgi:hypothetical protein